MARTSDPHAAAVKSWQTRERNLSQGDWRQRGAEAERALRNERVASIHELGGGISESYKVTLANGMKANFKIHRNPGGANNEVASWEIAKVVGMDDMVPPAALRTELVPGYNFSSGWPHYEGGRKEGSIAAWQDGTPAAKFDPDDDSVYDGAEDLQRAAMFDYITGNLDRHQGNWVINDNGQIRLIDHNIAFAEQTDAYSELLNRAVDRVQFGEMSSPAKFVTPYLDRKSEIVDAARKAGLRESQINYMIERIDRAASATSWMDLISPSTPPSRYTSSF